MMQQYFLKPYVVTVFLLTLFCDGSKTMNSSLLVLHRLISYLLFFFFIVSSFPASTDIMMEEKIMKVFCSMFVSKRSQNNVPKANSPTLSMFLKLSFLFVRLFVLGLVI